MSDLAIRRDYSKNLSRSKERVRANRSTLFGKVKDFFAMVGTFLIGAAIFCCFGLVGLWGFVDLSTSSETQAVYYKELVKMDTVLQKDLGSELAEQFHELVLKYNTFRTAGKVLKACDALVEIAELTPDVEKLGVVAMITLKDMKKYRYFELSFVRTFKRNGFQWVKRNYAERQLAKEKHLAKL
ncbi:MAG: hypothetical protein GY804_05150 [Alphaproteobacteria bacterium]|nr:hypothetical protein [Alphaproteobacteria bacterium]